jgi:RNA polymerase sigma factor (TIGR02999 family)
MPTLTELITASDAGDGAAATELFSALYSELHQLAEWQLRKGAAGATLGTTTLLHEAYLAMSERDRSSFPDRGRFLAYASKAMRGLIVDYVRARRAKKRGGEFEITRIDNEELVHAGAAPDPSVERLSEGLAQLEQIDPDLANLVDLHFFCGFSFVEIAELKGVSDRTIHRDWRKARMVLQRLVGDSQ